MNWIMRLKPITKVWVLINNDLRINILLLFTRVNHRGGCVSNRSDE